ncbi:MAG: leucine--tRNA ligase [Bdellovibrionota bacterium]
MTSYKHSEIQTKWAPKWVEANVCGAEDFSDKPKKYILVEFPYPSGTGLHMGHFLRYTLPDIYARKLRMSGFNVLFPFGWDAFGLPAENYAVQTGVHPEKTTEQAIENFTKSITEAGFGIDWDRIVNTTDPSYYKWTQWIFLKFYEAGLAEIREEPVWWCPELKTVLANEEVLEDEDGNKISERGEHPVEKRPLKQWVLKITEYADKLLDGLNNIDFPEYAKSAQRNWIGKSTGANISFPVISTSGKESKLDVFTTRPDTIFGATFMVVAPEHPLIDEFSAEIQNLAEVKAYREASDKLSDLDRQMSKDKTGVKLAGVSAKHPLTEDFPEIPIFVADYVLMGYGTGAIMAVPAHDERDFEFAKKYDLEIIQTVYPSVPKIDTPQADEDLPLTLDTGYIKLTSAVQTMLSTDAVEISCMDMKEEVVAALEKNNRGNKETTYRLRDWLFSRQRYWGEPIPILHKADGTLEAVADTNSPDDVAHNLPLLLPQVPDYTPSSDGSSPLAKNIEWVSAKAKDGSPAKRETNTMPNWAGSSWYYLRYIDPHNDQAIADQEKMKYWLPVDRYFGGSEHTTLHLLYSRFWHQFLYDQNVVPTPEPYAWRMNGGILLGEDGFKQSKSRGNVVDLNEMLDKFGADALRMYICFLGPYDATMSWNQGGLKACRRLIENIYDLQSKVSDQSTEDLEFTKLYHRINKRVTSMIDNLKMNTAVSEFMIFVNEAKKQPTIGHDTWNGFVRLIAPFAVFLAEELWRLLQKSKDWDKSKSIHLNQWPKYDPALTKEDSITIGIQVNGKVRAEIQVTQEDNETTVKDKVLSIPNVEKWLEGKEIKKFIYVPGKIVSLVVK